MEKHIGIVGAGFAGAVLAHELAKTGEYKITVMDERPHIGGNCYTERDHKTGVMLHQYGPHIFHTSRQDVWDYVNQFTKFGPYTNRVKAVTEKGVFSLPINLLTINQFFGKKLTPHEARDFVGSLGDRTIKEPKSFEDQALKFLGRDFYNNFFRGYTKKQWGVDPSELPASILQRLPVRFNYDDNYYNSKYQGIPVDGYTPIFAKMFDHPAITVKLGQRFDPATKSEYDHIFYSGPMDGYFKYQLGRLQYRSLVFERFDETGDYQGNAVINYCEEQVPYTRISEHKHFTPWEEHEETVCFKEYSKLAEEGDTPYYPLRLNNDKELLTKYVGLADQEKGITFIGRLGTYRYLDMHMVIGESLDLTKVCLGMDIKSWPKFSSRPV
ncbi:MAG: UDP-galactopyranose mutase [Bdellovibrionota bacterium]